MKTTLLFLLLVTAIPCLGQQSIPCTREEYDSLLTCEEYIRVLDLSWNRHLEIGRLERKISGLEARLVKDNPQTVIQNPDQVVSTHAKNLIFNNKAYTVYVVNPKTQKINLYNKISFGKYHDFQSIYNAVHIEGGQLVCAMNAGMYLSDRSPLGLYVVGGHQIRPLDLKKSSSRASNFYDLQPNGVFALDDKNKPYLVVTEDYNKLSQKVKINLATQSGPMLVVKNKINKHFNKGSNNLNIRNGVGVTKSGKVVFVISNDPVNFYEFSEFFRNILQCENALYLDGFVSRMYLPELFRSNLLDSGHLGPIITVEE